MPTDDRTEPKTPEEFARAMEALRGSDEEISHSAMDDLMVNLLRSLGYGAGCDTFEKQEKWYA